MSLRSGGRWSDRAPAMGTPERRVGSVTLKNPVMTASGTAGYGTELAASFDLAELGAVVVKSLAAFEWAGQPGASTAPDAGRDAQLGRPAGPGVPYWLDHVLPGLLRTGATVVASIWGRTVDEYRAAAELLAAAPDGVVAVEVNLSCPNLCTARPAARRGDLRPRPGSCPPRWSPPSPAVAGRPVWAKLSPNTDRVVEVAAAAQGCRRRGGDVHQHAARPGVRPRDPGVGARRRRTVGLSGPAIHPVAVRIVDDVAAALPGFPVIGVGGIATPWDAAEFLLAGAVAVQVGTATFHDPRGADPDPRRGSVPCDCSIPARDRGSPVRTHVRSRCAHIPSSRVGSASVSAHGNTSDTDA